MVVVVVVVVKEALNRDIATRYDCDISRRTSMSIYTDIATDHAHTMRSPDLNHRIQTHTL